jgi:ABC-2 type transport system ATP-binding protein
MIFREKNRKSKVGKGDTVLIEIQNLCRIRNGKEVLRDINLRIRNGGAEGSVYALLGPAGSGKTALAELMAGCVLPDRGSVTIGGYDTAKRPREAKKQVGYIPQGLRLPADMTVWEYLEFIAEAKGIRGEDAVRRIASVCRMTGIEDVRDTRAGVLPQAVCRRVALAQALLGDPEYLILDDPAWGLDAANSAVLYRLIRENAAGRTVVLAGRLSCGAQEYCDRVILLSGGSVASENGIGEIRRAAAPGGAVLHLTAKGDPQEIAGVLRTIAGVAEAVGEQASPGVAAVMVRLSPDAQGDGTDVRDEIFFTMAERRYAVLSMEAEERSMEDLYASLTREDRQ